ncbi:MAG: hypothetical protein H6779_05040 [Candidatus Nomurabacteria bacterium]|nr:hypothetical protein [Candidatus Nomurabacteria bacterium]USN87733.1 MAG: hypothetical protein H6779_05040 [Candidatus Nomurabacteria bacterium]
MSLAIQNYSYNTSGKTAFRDFFVNDSTAGIPSPYAKRFIYTNRYDYVHSFKPEGPIFDTDISRGKKASELNKKIVSNYLDAFQIENSIIKPEKVRSFLIKNRSIFGKLTKLITLALADYQDLIESICLRVLADESGKQEFVLVEFNLNEEIDVDDSIEIDDDFKYKNPDLSNNLINFDFV